MYATWRSRSAEDKMLNMDFVDTNEINDIN